MTTTVGVNIVGFDNASPAFLRAARNAEASSRRMNSAFKSSIAMASKMAGGFAAFELVKKAIDISKEASRFQAKMLLIQTQAGATAGEVKDFSKALLSMSGRVAKSPEDLATSLYHVYSTGLRGSKALEVVEVAAKGARIGVADLEETTNALTSTVVSGIKGVTNMGQAMGALNVIVGAGDMKLSDLNEALGGGILAVAKGFGLSLTEVGAALAVFGDNNIRGAEAATQLRMAIMALAKPIAGGTKALADIGLTGRNLKDDLAKGGLTKAVDDLDRHMKAAGVTGSKIGGFLTDAFGRRAGVGLAVLMGQVDRFHTKLHEIAKGAHDFDQSWAATKKTTSFVFDRLGAQVTAAGITVANKLLPPITQAAAVLGDTLPGAFTKLGSIMAPFGGFVGGTLAAAWHVLGAALLVAGAALGPIVALIDKLKTPLGAIATVAVAAVVAFKLFAAIPGILETVALKTMYARDAVVGFGVASKATAANFLTSSAVIAGSAEASAAAVATSGQAARVGWAGILGPIGAIAIGVGVLVSMFHKSSGASKEAAAAAKAYTDALSGGSGRTSIIDTITKQLSDNDVPKKIADLNKALGTTAVTGQQFVTAIESGGQPLDALRARLEGVIKSGTTVSVAVGRTGSAMMQMTPAAKSATKLLADLNSQFYGLTKATKKDLIDTKAFAGVSSSIDKVSGSAHVGSDTAKQYAAMMGIVVDKNGVAAVSSTTLAAALKTVSTAYAAATATGDDFLKALNAFAGSAASAADRAALIGATLKAANGDALNFASAMTGAFSANRDLVNAFGADAKNISDLKGQIADLRATSDGSADSARQLADLQNNLSDAYKNSERAAINLNKGTIDYAKGGAPALVSQLQAIQDSAVKAASAVYQHEVSTKGAKQAADDAYKVYRNQTRGQLIDEATQLGITKGQAKKLADQYFGMPKNIKTLIEAEGTNPIVTVLNKIGQMLANLTGQQWDIPVSVLVSTIENVGKGSGHGANQRTATFAAGTGGRGLPEGWAWVGDPGPHSELVHKRGSRVDVLNHAQSVKVASRLGMSVPAFAGGTTPSYTYDGVQYASQRAANNAANSARKSMVADAASGIAALLAAARSFLSTGSDLKDAAKQLRDAAAAGKVAAYTLNRFSREQGRLTSLGNRRDRVRDRLGTAPTAPTAYDRLATAQQNLADKKQSVKAAITGTFDISQAGASQYGEPVTLRGIRAQLAKAVANARRFTAVLRRLGKAGLNKALLSQLAEAGPSALPQALALASATPKELASINGQYRQLNVAGSSAGTYVADKMYGAGVHAAQGLVNGLRSQEKSLTKAIKRLADKMVAQLRQSLDMHSPSRLLYKEARLAFSGYENGIHSKHGDIARAAGHLGGASVPAGAGAHQAGRSGGYVHIENQHLHVHYPEEGDLDGALKQLTRMSASQIRVASQELGR